MEANRNKFCNFVDILKYFSHVNSRRKLLESQKKFEMLLILDECKCQQLFIYYKFDGAKVWKKNWSEIKTTMDHINMQTV